MTCRWDLPLGPRDEAARQREHLLLPPDMAPAL